MCTVDEEIGVCDAKVCALFHGRESQRPVHHWVRECPSAAGVAFFVYAVCD